MQKVRKINEEYERKREKEKREGRGMGKIYLVSDKIQRSCVEINYGVIAIVNPSVEYADLTLSFVANHRAGHTLNRFYIRRKINKWNVASARTGEPRVVFCVYLVLIFK